MWIFGYGSLVWKVDFPYVKKVIGYIKGYDRKFWQQSIDHRGVPEKPGRVVTLVPSSDPEDKVWGVAYEIDDRDIDTIASLNHRERRFDQIMLNFYPYNNSNAGLDELYKGEFSNMPDTTFVAASVYIGPQDGPLFVGYATVKDIANQIIRASGPSGPNSEYIFNLSKFMRKYLPHVQDSHLFDIEKELLSLYEKEEQ